MLRIYIATVGLMCLCRGGSPSAAAWRAPSCRPDWLACAGAAIGLPLARDACPRVCAVCAVCAVYAVCFGGLPMRASFTLLTCALNPIGTRARMDRACHMRASLARRAPPRARMVGKPWIQNRPRPHPGPTPALPQTRPRTHPGTAPFPPRNRPGTALEPPPSSIYRIVDTNLKKIYNYGVHGVPGSAAAWHS